jgi:Fe-S-cluster-containing dehydrogenase component
MTACKCNHNIPIGRHEGREYYRIWPAEIERGEYPYVVRDMTPIVCMHCDDPACLEACPNPGAIYKRADGIVLIEDGKCTGCKECIPACPYDALYFREDKGVVDKCTFCVENIDVGSQPECVKTCPADAMYFGDISNPESKISKLVKEWKAKPLDVEHQTKPSVYYTSHAGRLRGIMGSKKTGCTVEGAMISLKCIDTGESWVTNTDEQGIFFFWNLKVQGKYSMRIEANGLILNQVEVYLNKEYTDLGKTEI